MSSIAFGRISKTYNKSFLVKSLTALAGASAIATYFYQNNNNNNNKHKDKGPLLGLLGFNGDINVRKSRVPDGKGFKDYQKVYNEIAQKLEDHPEWDEYDGYYGVLLRLSWHSSGTYSKDSNTGGSFGGTMIYGPEKDDKENKGLTNGQDFLEPLLKKYPWISRGDLWTLGGVCAVQESGGPKIKWLPGRQNDDTGKHVPENGLLPDASRDGPYVRKVFNRIGFNDRETVALIGAHCLGRCHREYSGFLGPWTSSPSTFSNLFYTELLGKWHVKKWDGPKQYEDEETSNLMMLPTDMSLKEEPYFVKYVKMYADDEELFFKDFAEAYAKLISNGVTYPKDEKPYIFKTLDEQEEN
ncbi:unnamed protein product [Candida verbasci]|uniref:Peroxidase n=1 Tax=Candida verbasci TaxID=1227364 RepID=A0A9W4XDK7_9ASCO|nr:unnamed protein product [Candida verbasci]